MSSFKKKTFAVSALTLGGLAGATGTAYAGQGGVNSEVPDNAPSTVVESPTGGGQNGTATKSPSTPAASQESAPAPSIADVEESQPAATAKTGGGQGGVVSEAPSSPASQASTPDSQDSKPAPATTDADVSPAAATSGTGGGQGGVSTELPEERGADRGAEETNVPAPETEVPTQGRESQETESAATQQATRVDTGGATIKQVAHATPTQTQQTSTDAGAGQGGITTETPSTGTYTDIADTTTDTAVGADGGEQATSGQGGVLSEMPASDPAGGETDTDTATTGGQANIVEDPAPTHGSTDYAERVEQASATPTSDTYAPAQPAAPTGDVSTYSEPRQSDTGAVNGGEAGVVGQNVSTGTAAQWSDTTSHVSNTTVGGGEQATAAQTWDASNGNYNATWSTSGGVSGTGGVSATNTQTEPNVGSASVDGQWSSPDGASSVNVTGGATLQDFGVHGASGSVEVQTPVGDMSFAF